MNEFIESLDIYQKILLAIIWTGLAYFLVGQFFLLVTDILKIVALIAKMPILLWRRFTDEKD